MSSSPPRTLSRPVWTGRDRPEFALPNTLDIIGQGTRADYSFSATGFLEGVSLTREDLLDGVGDLLNENMRSGSVDDACEFTREMLPAVERVVEHPDMTEELADILSTRAVEVKYRVKCGVTVRNE